MPNSRTEAFVARTEDFEEYPLHLVHQLMEPGPTVLVATQNNGTPNLMTNGFNMPITHVPSTLGITLGPWDYSFQALRNTRECVIAIPSADLAEKVVDVGNSSGRDVNKWSEFGFTPMQPAQVSAPLVRECFANIECVVADDRLVDDYDLWVLQPVRAWYAPGLRGSGELHHRGNGTFTTNGSVIDLRQRMTKWPSLAV